jgi:hypothetical protein
MAAVIDTRMPLRSSQTARAAFAELAGQRPCGGPDACGQLTVTARSRAR